MKYNEDFRFFTLTAFLQPRQYITKRAFQRLDLLLLAIESLDTDASQAIVLSIEKLKLGDYFPNKVELWKFRCHNPMRKAFRYGCSSQDYFEALISLLSFMSDYFYPKIRNLLSSKEPDEINKERWNIFNTRFNELMQERLNIKKSLVKRYILENKDNLYRELVLTLALASGDGGKKRLQASLSDPII